MNLDVESLGQVFTPPHIVSDMLALVQNSGRFLEPSCGNGAFYENLPSNKVGIELDSSVACKGALRLDFFSYPVSENLIPLLAIPLM